MCVHVSASGCPSDQMGYSKVGSQCRDPIEWLVDNRRRGSRGCSALHKTRQDSHKLRRRYSRYFCSATNTIPSLPSVGIMTCLGVNSQTPRLKEVSRSKGKEPQPRGGDRSLTEFAFAGNREG